MFQKTVMGMLIPSGIVEPHGLTIDRLQQSSIKTMLSSPVVPPATGKTGTLTEADYVSAAAALRCEAATIKAVAIVEVGDRQFFDNQGRPTILFERHYFHRLTNKVYDRTSRSLISQIWSYGVFSQQYPKFERACLLDRRAAMMSTSWGGFQIMGENYKTAGFAGPEDSVYAMRQTVQDHLKAFVSVVSNNALLLSAVQKKDWTAFATIYNGRGFRKLAKTPEDAYDVRMARAYDRIKK